MNLATNVEGVEGGHKITYGELNGGPGLALSRVADTGADPVVVLLCAHKKGNIRCGKESMIHRLNITNRR